MKSKHNRKNSLPWMESRLSIAEIRNGLENMGFSDKLIRHRVTAETYEKNRWTYIKNGREILVAISDLDAEKMVLKEKQYRDSLR